MNLATSCNLVHVLTSYNLSFRFGTYAAPLPSSSLWTYATPLPSSPFLSFVVSQNYLNSISFHGTNRQTLLNDFVRHAQIQNIQLKLQISSSRFPLLLFTLSHTPTHKLHYRSILSQDTLQSSAVANLVELHASLLVAQDVNQRGPRFAKETLQGQITPQLILFANSKLFLANQKPRKSMSSPCLLHAELLKRLE